MAVRVEVDAVCDLCGTHPEGGAKELIAVCSTCDSKGVSNEYLVIREIGELKAKINDLTNEILILKANL
jgi:hypothetical protein